MAAEFCTSCGSPIVHNSTFCEVCGTARNTGARPTAPVGPQFAPPAGLPYGAPPPRPQKSSQNRLVVLSLVIGLPLLLMGGCVILMGIGSSIQRNAEKDGNASSTAAPATTESAPAPKKDADAPKEETPASHLAAAKALLVDNVSEEDTDKARKHLDAIPESAPEFEEEKALRKKLDEIAGRRLTQELSRTAKGRETLVYILKTSYLNLLQQSNPTFNLIQIKVVKSKGGDMLTGVHAFYTSESFAIGALAGNVTQWIAVNRETLRSAHITRVGVTNKSGFLGSATLPVE